MGWCGLCALAAECTQTPACSPLASKGDHPLSSTRSPPHTAKHHKCSQGPCQPQPKGGAVSLRGVPSSTACLRAHTNKHTDSRSRLGRGRLTQESALLVLSPLEHMGILPQPVFDLSGMSQGGLAHMPSPEASIWGWAWSAVASCKTSAAASAWLVALQVAAIQHTARIGRHTARSVIHVSCLSAHNKQKGGT